MEKKKKKKEKKEDKVDLTFLLKGIDDKKIEEKYIVKQNELFCDNKTKIEDLYTNKNTIKKITIVEQDNSIIKLIPCCLSLDLKPLPLKTNMPCMWDRHTFNTVPLGIPIKWHPSYFVKEFSNESGEKYTVKQYVSKKSREKLEKRREENLQLYKQEFFSTDGIVCSFNCMLAFIQSTKDKTYKNSYYLAKLLYKKIFNRTETIEPAEDPCRLLKEYGGIYDIEEYRSNFNNIKYIDTHQYNNSLMHPVCRLLQEIDLNERN